MSRAPNGRSQETVLITGASGGIGYELAELFAREGFRLVLVARREDKLRAVAENFQKKFGSQVTILRKDLSGAGAAREIFEAAARENLAVDILVNNAGFGAWGYFAELDASLQLEMIELNVKTLTHLTRLFLPEMLQRKKGKILNVASTAAFQPGPLMAVYYATKAYVLSFSEALANELKGKGITVTALCPGHTATDFQERAAIGRIRLLAAGRMSAKQVAAIGYNGLMKGKTIVIPGALNQIAASSVRFAPRKLVTAVVRFLQGH